MACTEKTTLPLRRLCKCGWQTNEYENGTSLGWHRRKKTDVGTLVETTVPGPRVIVTDTVTIIVIGVIIIITTTITITIIILCCKGVFSARKTNSSCVDVLDPRISRLKEPLCSDSLDYKYCTRLHVNYTYSHALKFFRLITLTCNFSYVS